jgi:hypothetical protein
MPPISRVGDGVSLPVFSHLPPQKGRLTWPGGPDFQWYRMLPTLTDVWVYVDASGYLEDGDIFNGKHSSNGTKVFARGTKIGPLWLTRPWQPIRRRVWGFGTTSADRSCTHDAPNPVMLIHFVWTF